MANDNNEMFKRIEKRSKNLILSGFIYKSQENNSIVLNNSQILDIIGKQPQENVVYEIITTMAIAQVQPKLNNIYITPRVDDIIGSRQIEAPPFGRELQKAYDNGNISSINKELCNKIAKEGKNSLGNVQRKELIYSIVFLVTRDNVKPEFGGKPIEVLPRGNKLQNLCDNGYISSSTIDGDNGISSNDNCLFDI